MSGTCTTTGTGDSCASVDSTVAVDGPCMEILEKTVRSSERCIPLHYIIAKKRLEVAFLHRGDGNLKLLEKVRESREGKAKLVV